MFLITTATTHFIPITIMVAILRGTPVCIFRSVARGEAIIQAITVHFLTATIPLIIRGIRAIIRPIIPTIVAPIITILPKPMGVSTATVLLPLL